MLIYASSLHTSAELWTDFTPILAPLLFKPHLEKFIAGGLSGRCPAPMAGGELRLSLGAVGNNVY